jgi:hypothetical protein
MRCADCRFVFRYDNGDLECENPLVFGTCDPVGAVSSNGLRAVAGEVADVSIEVGADFGCVRYEVRNADCGGGQNAPQQPLYKIANVVSS